MDVFYWFFNPPSRESFKFGFIWAVIPRPCHLRNQIFPLLGNSMLTSLSQKMVGYNNEGLVQMMFLFKQLIFSFQPIKIPGCKTKKMTSSLPFGTPKAR